MEVYVQGSGHSTPGGAFQQALWFFNFWQRLFKQIASLFPPPVRTDSSNLSRLLRLSMYVVPFM
jgi:hypothetical protein